MATKAQNYLKHNADDIFSFLQQYYNFVNKIADDEEDKEYINTKITHIKYKIRQSVRDATECVRPSGVKGKKKALYISAAAKDQLANGNGKDLCYEHVYPVTLMAQHITENGKDWSIDDIIAYINEWSITALITKEEDAILKAAGLNSKLPKGSDKNDKFARYKNHIEVEERTTEMFKEHAKYGR